MTTKTRPDRRWVDVLLLLRIDGTWKIVNKIATHASRGGWAANSRRSRQRVRPAGSRDTGGDARREARCADRGVDGRDRRPAAAP